MGQPTGAQRRQIEVFRDRITVLKQNRQNLLQQPHSANRTMQINKIDNDISTNKNALLRIYSSCNFHPMDIHLL